MEPHQSVRSKPQAFEPDLAVVQSNPRFCWLRPMQAVGIRDLGGLTTTGDATISNSARDARSPAPHRVMGVLRMGAQALQ
jgi:hypothetical protein